MLTCMLMPRIMSTTPAIELCVRRDEPETRTWHACTSELEICPGRDESRTNSAREHNVTSAFLSFPRSKGAKMSVRDNAKIAAVPMQVVAASFSEPRARRCFEFALALFPLRGDRAHFLRDGRIQL